MSILNKLFPQSIDDGLFVMCRDADQAYADYKERDDTAVCALSTKDDSVTYVFIRMEHMKKLLAEDE